MICRPCATGADLAQTTRADIAASIAASVGQPPSPFQMSMVRHSVESAHGECLGCDCQHKINLDPK